MKNYCNLKNKIQKQSGFTLVETLVTIFIFSLLMLGTSLIMKNILTFSKQQNGVLTNVDAGRRIAGGFVDEIRNAANGANGSYSINQAADNQIIFFSTLTKPGTISKVRYYITGNTLYKGVTNPAGSPPSYNGQSEKITALSNQMSMGANPLFYYYDGSYDGSGSPLVQPVNVNVIKFVKINLIILKQLVQNGSDTFTVLAGASIRNLKTNLGN